MPATKGGSKREELLSLFHEVLGGRAVCEACGTVGEWEEVGGQRACAACHAGCGLERCRQAYAEGRSPIEARLWRRAAHAQADPQDQAAALAFRAELANYEATERSRQA